ncbi:MAG TPA: 2-dehydropantoate 2-reductase, partial [Chloroflexota bacterium]|nr:2-dehydropantoate 2-reductase [Chloroflexota bacterium]
PALQEAVASHGLIIREPDGERVVHPPVATLSAAVDPCDAVLLTVRTYDVAAAIDDVHRLLAASGKLIAFQNGVGTEELLADRLGRNRVIAGTLTASVGQEKPGEIRRYSRAGGVALAAMDGSRVPGWTVDLFATTGLPTITVADYRSLRWSKLLLNMLAAPTSAILDMDIGDLVNDPRVFRIEQRAFREAARVMDRLGIRTVALPGYAVPQARLAMRLPRSLAQRLLSRRIARARSGRSPGMRTEMRRGRLEVDAYNGAIARAAGRAGVPAPVNTALTALAVDLAEHPERRDELRGRPEKLARYLASQGVKL